VREAKIEEKVLKVLMRGRFKDSFLLKAEF